MTGRRNRLGGVASVCCVAGAVLLAAPGAHAQASAQASPRAAASPPAQANPHATVNQAPPPSPAQAITQSAKRKAPTKALVVSGGVSLGSYQAGFLYYYTTALSLLAPTESGTDADRFRIAAGASAGAINTVMSAIAGCREPDLDPETSAFYQAWIPVGLTKLRGDGGSRYGLFTSESLDSAKNVVRAVMNADKGWKPGACEALLALTATRMKARRVDVPDEDQDRNAHAVGLMKQTEKFLLRARVDDQKLRFGAYRPVWEANQPLVSEIYPTLGTKSAASPDAAEASVEDVLTLMQASSAFPLAFPPVDVPLQTWSAQSSEPTKLKSQIGSTTFTDGGLLDNTPLRVVLKMLDSEARRAAAENPGAPAEARDALVLFSKADSEAWRQPAGQTTATYTHSDSIVVDMAKLVGEFVGNTSDIEALEALESVVSENARHAEPASAAPDAEVVDAQRVIGHVATEVPGRGMPIAGQFLEHFSAFLESDFREFDFYEGMVDAKEHLEKHLGLPPKIPFTSKKLPCYADYRALTNAQRQTEDPPELPPSCAALNANQTALLFASARVRQAEWRRVPAKAGEAAKEDETDTKQRDLIEFQTFASALEEKKFRYRDFADGDVLSFAELQSAIASHLHHAVHDLGRAQGGVFSLPVLGTSVLGKVAANLYQNVNVKYWALGFANGLEGGFGYPLWSSASGHWGWFVFSRLQYAHPSRFFAVDAASQIESGAGRLNTMDAVLSGDTRLAWSPDALPASFELGVGYEGRLKTPTFPKALAVLPHLDWVSFRHGIVASLSVVFIQRIYVSMYLDRWVNAPCGPISNCASVNSAYRSYVGVEEATWAPSLTLGWRALY